MHKIDKTWYSTIGRHKNALDGTSFLRPWARYCGNVHQNEENENKVVEKETIDDKSLQKLENKELRLSGVVIDVEHKETQKGN